MRARRLAADDLGGVPERERALTGTPALWTKHRRLALGIAREFYFPGADHSDVQQEALIGLWEACGGYDPDRGPFPPYARAVIRNRLRQELTRARRLGRLLLTDSSRDPIEQHPGLLSLEDTVILREDARRLLGLILQLSVLERESLLSVSNGIPYAQQGYSRKSIDNAIQRARRKLRALQLDHHTLEGDPHA